MTQRAFCACLLTWGSFLTWSYLPPASLSEDRSWKVLSFSNSLGTKEQLSYLIPLPTPWDQNKVFVVVALFLSWVSDHQGVNPYPLRIYAECWEHGPSRWYHLSYHPFTLPSLEIIRLLPAVWAIQLPCSPRIDKSQCWPSTQMERKYLGIMAWNSR